MLERQSRSCSRLWQSLLPPSAASDNNIIQMKWCWCWFWDQVKFCVLIVCLSVSCLAARCWSPFFVLNDTKSFKAEPEKKLKTMLMSLSALLLNSLLTKEVSEISCQVQLHVENKALTGSTTVLWLLPSSQNPKKSNLRCSQSDLWVL